MGEAKRKMDMKEQLRELINNWIKQYAYLEDNEANRKVFPGDNWYSQNGKDPLRTVVSHVGLDKLRKLVTLFQPNLAELAQYREMFEKLRVEEECDY